jgi:hypothetical protein
MRLLRDIMLQLALEAIAHKLLQEASVLALSIALFAKVCPTADDPKD